MACAIISSPSCMIVRLTPMERNVRLTHIGVILSNLNYNSEQTTFYWSKFKSTYRAYHVKPPPPLTPPLFYVKIWSGNLSKNSNSFYFACNALSPPHPPFYTSDFCPRGGGLNMIRTVCLITNSWLSPLGPRDSPIMKKIRMILF